MSTALIRESPDGTSPALLSRRFAFALLALTAGFILPLIELVRFALGSELYSYIPLIPLIAAYLVWLRRHLAIRDSFPISRWAAAPFIAAAAILLAFGLGASARASMAVDERLAAMTGAYVLSVVAAACFFLSRHTLRTVAFPLAFLAFMVPLPVGVRDGIDVFSQHGSAAIAHAIFSVVGTPFFREELVFQLPGIAIEVAPQCSGIHSSLVLLITSLVAGDLFLRSSVNRALLAFAVIPLALLRNGVRVFTIGQLCVSFGPEMIHSALHRRGGPLFFAASLVPLFLLLWFFWRIERRGRTESPASPVTVEPQPARPA